MKITTFGDNLIQLTRFPVLFPVNCYLVREDDGFTLIDTALPGSAPAILAVAQAHGGPIRRIVLTHAHMDHVASLDALHATLPDAEVLISARDARFLRGERSLDDGEMQGKLRGSYQTCATRPTRELAPGDRIASLEAIAAPGHTPGHMAFYDTRDHALIAGDAFQTRGGVAVSGTLRPLFPFVAIATWHAPTALASARALRALEPSCLAIGHGVVLTAPLPAMDQAIADAARHLNEDLTHAA
ncbi:MAG TPA: MBL fold metallo-hydrolase [Roseiflexaceae bacterium]|nr:MBL fold metallo-hydrolase [Roseiflexaceae bacterium]